MHTPSNLSNAPSSSSLFFKRTRGILQSSMCIFLVPLVFFIFEIPLTYYYIGILFIVGYLLILGLILQKNPYSSIEFTPSQIILKSGIFRSKYRKISAQELIQIEIRIEISEGTESSIYIKPYIILRDKNKKTEEFRMKYYFSSSNPVQDGRKVYSHCILHYPDVITSIFKYDGHREVDLSRDLLRI